MDFATSRNRLMRLASQREGSGGGDGIADKGSDASGGEPAKFLLLMNGDDRLAGGAALRAFCKVSVSC